MPENLPTVLKSDDNMEKIAIGCDVGGSHITCQLYNLDNKQLIPGTKVRKPVNCHASATEIIGIWADTIGDSAVGTDLLNLFGIGFAMPGPFDYPNGIAWFRDVEKFDNLYGVNIGQEIRQRLQLPTNYPVRFLNDAACFAVGESYMGGAIHHKRLLAITLGTGFGTTFIDKHLPVAGKHGIPDDGFLYRVPFENSLADDYFSTRWFLNEYEVLSGRVVAGVKQLAENAATDNQINGLFAKFGENLGSFLVPWLKQFNAECLVIGGNISAAYNLFGEKLSAEFNKAGIQVEVLLSTLGEDAALAGSAMLCDDGLYSAMMNRK